MMSPTLLEATIVLILIVLGWQIGVRIAPTVLTYWQTARQQIAQIEESQPAEQTLSFTTLSSIEESNKESNKESNHERELGSECKKNTAHQ